MHCFGRVRGKEIAYFIHDGTCYHHVSTDEVYGDLSLDDPARFTEENLTIRQVLIVQPGQFQIAGLCLGP